MPAREAGMCVYGGVVRDGAPRHLKTSLLDVVRILVNVAG
ncbi:protein of unknown function [Burkholderia multivorans]